MTVWLQEGKMRFRDLQRYPLREVLRHLNGGDNEIESDGVVVFRLIPRDSQAKPLEVQAQTTVDGIKGLGVTPHDSHDWCTVCSRQHAPPMHGSKSVSIPGLVMDGNRIVGLAHNTAPTMANQPLGALPLYNPMLHKPGDRVMVYQGKRLVPTVVPSLDADGHLMPL